MINKKVWVDLLTKGKEDKEREFMEVLNNSKSDVLGIMKYRRLQMEEGRGQNINANDIKKAWNDNNKLQTLLQELFLEPIPMGHIKFAKEKGLNKNNIKKLYDRHIQDNGTRFLSLVLTL